MLSLKSVAQLFIEVGIMRRVKMLNISISQFSYGEKEVLKNIHIQIDNPRIIGLVAPNGTGKSTLIEIIAGNLNHKDVSVLLDDKNYKNHYLDMKRRIVRMCNQDDLYSYLTGLQHLQFYAEMWNIKPSFVDEVVSKLQMAEYISNKVSSYSLGMKQRLCFALVVVTNCEVMLLDEVMNGLDPDNVQLISNVLRSLKNEGKIIIIASHLLNNLNSIADEVYFLKDKRIALKYNLEDQCNQSIEIQFSSEDRYKEFMEQFININILSNPSELAISMKDLNELDLIFSWIQSNLKDISSLTYGIKGCEIIYQELFHSDDEGRE